MAPAALPMRALHRLNDDGARGRPISATATRVRCSRASTPAGFRDVAHGPMPADLKREGGEEAIKRSLAYLMTRDAAALEPSVSSEPADRRLQHHDPEPPHRHAASARPRGPRPDARRGVGVHVPHRPRALSHHEQPADPRASPASGSAAAAPSRPTIPTSARPRRRSSQHWCEVSGIPYLGRADIGHDVANKIVPFGRFRAAANTVA